MSSNDGLQVAYDPGKYPAGNHYPRAAEPESQNEKMQAGQRSTICGVSGKVFFITIAVATTAILAVALGAGLGAGLSKSSGSNASSQSFTASVVTITATPTPAASSTTSAVASSSSSAPPSSIISGSNNTEYISEIFASGANGPVPSGAANYLKFQKRCGASIPVYQNLAETHVYSFDSCIDLCAGYNFWNSQEPACTGCTYDYKGTCWIKWGRAWGLWRVRLMLRLCCCGRRRGMSLLSGFVVKCSLSII